MYSDTILQEGARQRIMVIELDENDILRIGQGYPLLGTSSNVTKWSFQKEGWTMTLQSSCLLWASWISAHILHAGTDHQLCSQYLVREELQLSYPTSYLVHNCTPVVQFSCYQHRYEWKGLWCSSTVRLLSTQIWMDVKAPSILG